MKRIVHKVATVVTLLAAVGLLLSGLSKLLNPSEFAAAVAEHQLIPSSLRGGVVAIIPWTEISASAIAIAMLCASSRRHRAALVLAAVFMVLFGYATIAGWTNASGKAGCGCGLRRGIVESWWPIVLENAVTAIALLLSGRVLAFADDLPRRREPDRPASDKSETQCVVGRTEVYPSRK
ncbi:MAG: hypothetical protein K2Y21_00430 [Phycisphaerales bacterium]|nr:hypothetical protein [Phycisphaerales bacterium]